MIYSIKESSQFKKDYKAAIRRNWNIKLLDNVIAMLANGQTLPFRYRDHPLKGKYKGYRECHVQPDWLLVYCLKKDTLVLILAQTGKHNELFE